MATLWTPPHLQAFAFALSKLELLVHLVLVHLVFVHLAFFHLAFFHLSATIPPNHGIHHPSRRPVHFRGVFL